MEPGNVQATTEVPGSCFPSGCGWQYVDVGQCGCVVELGVWREVGVCDGGQYRCGGEWVWVGVGVGWVCRGEWGCGGEWVCVTQIPLDIRGTKVGTSQNRL